MHGKFKTAIGGVSAKVKDRKRDVKMPSKMSSKEMMLKKRQSMRKKR